MTTCAVECPACAATACMAMLADDRYRCPECGAITDADELTHIQESSMNIHDYEHRPDEYVTAANRQADADARDSRAFAAERREEQNYGTEPEHHIEDHYTVPAPTKAHDYERLTVECPQCHAAAGQRCTNYRGQRCAPHGKRKAPTAPLSATPATTSAAEPPKGKIEAIRTTKPAPEIDADASLAAACERLVWRYGHGNVLDAVWAADKIVWAERQRQQQSQPSKAS